MGVFFIILGFILTMHCLNRNINMLWPLVVLGISAVFIAGGVEMCIHHMV